MFISKQITKLINILFTHGLLYTSTVATRLYSRPRRPPSSREAHIVAMDRGIILNGFMKTADELVIQGSLPLPIRLSS